MISKIDHIGIAVKDIEKALQFYRDVLHLEVENTEMVEAQGIVAACLRVGESELELLQPLHDDSPVGKFIAKKGEGIHHIALGVDDLDKAVQEAVQSGCRLVTEKPQIGVGGAKMIFIHPASTGGVLLELYERNGG